MSESDFIEAADIGDLITVQSLVDKVSINSKKNGATALYKAVSKGNLDVVQFLVARPDIDVNMAEDVRTKDCLHLMLSLLVPLIYILNTVLYHVLLPSRCIHAIHGTLSCVVFLSVHSIYPLFLL